MSLKTEIAKIRQLMPQPIRFGKYISYERHTAWLMRGMRGEEQILALLQMHPQQKSLTDDPRGGCLLDVIRALWLDQPPPQAEAKAAVANQPSPPAPASEPSPVPSAEVPAVVPSQTSQQGESTSEPAAPSAWFQLMEMLGVDDGTLPVERATSMGMTVAAMDAHPPRRERILTEVERARTDVVWLRVKGKTTFHIGNNYYTTDPTRLQPEAAPLWIREDQTNFQYALRAGIVEEV